MNKKNKFLILFSFLMLASCSKNDDANILLHSNCRLKSIEFATIRKNPTPIQSKIVSQGTSEFEYEADKLVKLSSFDEQGLLNGWYSYVYNNQNQVVSVVFNDVQSNNVVSDTIQKLIYENNGRLLQVLLFDLSGTDEIDTLNFNYPNQNTIFYSFDEYGYEYKYDSLLNLVSVVTTEYDITNPYFRTFYKYDEAKNPFHSFPFYPFDVLTYFSKSNLIGHSGTSDSTLVIDPAQLSYNYHRQIRYNSANYPIEIIENSSGDTYDQSILSYYCN